jgi:hypothetical protein
MLQIILFGFFKTNKTKIDAAAAGGGYLVDVPSHLKDAHSTIILPFEDLQAMLADHRSSLKRKVGDVKMAIPTSEKLISSLEAKIVICFQHVQSLLQVVKKQNKDCGVLFCLFQSWQDSVDFIEELLREQLIAAIGKYLQPEDFAEYFSFFFFFFFFYFFL